MTASRIASASSAKRDTTPDLLLRRALRAVGLRYRIDVASLPGRPDLVIPAARLAIFCDGDFWHGNPRNFKLPQTNPEFWMKKIQYNRAKDRRVTRFWRGRGWTVIRIWESTLKRCPDVCLNRVVRALEKLML